MTADRKKELSASSDHGVLGGGLHLRDTYEYVFIWRSAIAPEYRHNVTPPGVFKQARAVFFL